MNLVPNHNDLCGRLVLLAPAAAHIPDTFAKVETSSRDHEQLLRSAQRLRAKLYRDDGAIRDSQVAHDGSHRHPADEHAWHVLSLGRNEEVIGCSRYLAHPNTVSFSRLGVGEAALAHTWEWGTLLRTVVDSEIALARRRGIAYVEVGGWALDPTSRYTAEAVRIALATYSLARVLGGCIGITTATRRHCSSAILRKIGGRTLRIDNLELPAYYDPQYDCEMELLRFDSYEPNPRYESWIEDLRSHLSAALVIQSPARPQNSKPENTQPKEESPERHAETHEQSQSSRRESWKFGQHRVHAVQ
jgi:hypothetical protein